MAFPELKGLSLKDRLSHPTEILRTALSQFSRKLRVAEPGIIVDFDSTELVVSVRLAITEDLLIEGKHSIVEIPILKDVPIVLPHTDEYAITFPIKSGDECLVIFADMCIDAWWEKGGVQNQMERRRHDLSDGFAILAPWSQPKRISNYNTEAMELRTFDGNTAISIKSDLVTIKSLLTMVEGDLTVTGEILTQQNNINLSTHTHDDVMSGVSTSGSPTSGS